MGLFRKTARNEVPGDLVALMERFGRHEIDPTKSTDDGYAVFQATQAPLIPLSQANPEGLVTALADACVPKGGWAAYGADRTVVNLLSPTPPGQDWHRILDASMHFLRSNYVPPIRVPGYMWDRFIDTGGSANTWLPLREPPDRASTTIRPLGDTEVRPLIKLGPEPDANAILLAHDGSDYVALIDSKWSDDDPTRSRSEWKRSKALYDLYLDIAWSTQVWDWADSEIEPFFPAPKALI